MVVFVTDRGSLMRIYPQLLAAMGLIISSSSLAPLPSAAGWERTSYTLSAPTLITEWIYMQQNTQQQPVQIAYTASGAWYQNVTGEVSNDPPWSSPFTPLSEAWGYLQDINRSVTIPTGTTFYRRYSRVRQTGSESWVYRIDEETLVNYEPRSRFWETDYILWDDWTTP
jgi:hypothetical protein